MEETLGLDEGMDAGTRRAQTVYEQWESVLVSAVSVGMKEHYSAGPRQHNQR